MAVADPHVGQARCPGSGLGLFGMAHLCYEHPNSWLHPRGGCVKELSLQDQLQARVTADFERR